MTEISHASVQCSSQKKWVECHNDIWLMKYRQKVNAATNFDGFVFYLLLCWQKKTKTMRWFLASTSGWQSQPTEWINFMNEKRESNKNTEIYYDFDMQFSIHFVLNSLLNLIFGGKKETVWNVLCIRMKINTISSVFVVNERIWICQLYNGNEIVWRCSDNRRTLLAAVKRTTCKAQ